MTLILIQIELLVVFSIIAFVFAWAVWFRFTKKRALKKYNPYNDRARKGEEKRLEEIREEERNGTGDGEPKERDRKTKDTKPSTPIPSSIAPGPPPTEGTDLLQTTTPVAVGRNKKRPGKAIRNPFRRRTK